MSSAATDITYRAFGRTVTLASACSQPEINRRLREMDEIYTRTLASRSLPKAGLCVDLGAGDGWFGLAFAQAFPKWHVLCLEPDASCFAQLQDNAARLGLGNVTCVQAAVHPDVASAGVPPRKPKDLAPGGALLKALNTIKEAPFTPLVALAPRMAPATSDTPENETVTAPALPLDLLDALRPDLLKLEAPTLEGAIGHALKDTPVGVIMGQLYTYVKSDVFNPGPDAGPRAFYLEHHTHVLRRDYEDNFDHRRPGLDIVVAMYNTKDFIIECVDSLLAGGNPDITVLVVDDGSTDGCGDLVEREYAGNPRVRLLRKANGGCASARNYGRVHSDASHIAFLDADDRVDAGMFTALLETARYTGAYVTEGEFATFTTDADGKDVFTPSYETDLYPQAGNQGLGEYDYLWIPGHDICFGQPTIWRRVHRRDFLDNKNIWFPEHVRAFDDQIFQFLVGEYSGTIAHVRGYNYHYRQHPAQDIKQGDERHFYSFNMFRKMVIRSLEESWPNTEPLRASLLNTMSWSYSGLRSDLKRIYSEAAAKFLAVLSKTYEYDFTDEDLTRTGIDDLAELLARDLKEMEDYPPSYGYIRLESWRWQPEFIRMMQKLPATGRGS